MYLNFSIFRGRALAGGTSLGPKTGTSVGWGGGGIDKIFAGWGDPPVPQEKNPVRGSSPPNCPPQKAKWPKSSIFGIFLNFCPLRMAFCPLDAPHKNTGAATATRNHRYTRKRTWSQWRAPRFAKHGGPGLTHWCFLQYFAKIHPIYVIELYNLGSFVSYEITTIDLPNFVKKRLKRQAQTYPGGHSILWDAPRATKKADPIF